MPDQESANKDGGGGGNGNKGESGKKISQKEDDSKLLGAAADSGAPLGKVHDNLTGKLADDHQAALDETKANAADVQSKAGAAQGAADANRAVLDAKNLEVQAAPQNGDIKGGMAAAADSDKLAAEHSQLSNAADDLQTKADDLGKVVDDLESNAPKKTNFEGPLDKVGKLFDIKDAVEAGWNAGEAINEGDYRKASGEAGKGMGGIVGGDFGAGLGLKAGLALAPYGLACGPAAVVCVPAIVVGSTIGGALVGSSAGELVGQAAGEIGYDAANAVYNYTQPPATATAPLPNSSVPPVTYSCFPCQTLVHTPSGDLPIERLAVGDEVLTFSELTGEVVPKKILKKMQAFVPKLWKVQLDDETVLTTRLHRFRKSSGEWIPAELLTPGSQVLTLTGSNVRVKSSEVLDDAQLVINLEIEENHNYFVGSGVLVHNMQFNGGTPRK